MDRFELAFREFDRRRMFFSLADVPWSGAQSPCIIVVYWLQSVDRTCSCTRVWRQLTNGHLHYRYYRVVFIIES